MLKDKFIFEQAMNTAGNRRVGGTDRSVSHLEVIRDMADDIMSRSQEFLARTEDRFHYSFYQANYDVKFISKKARVISVILYAVFVSVCAVILGLYYMFQYHPPTDRLFKEQ